MNSTTLPFFQFGINCQGFTTARLTWPTYVDGRELENSAVWKYRIMVASTCRRSVRFGCYLTWLWMANGVSVIIKMLSFLTSPSLVMGGEPGKRDDVRAISMKVGKLADNAWKKICANFQRCRSGGFRDMTFQKIEKRSIFATGPVSQMPITFFH